MDNYYITAERMYQAAKDLENSGQYYVASYIVGYVVECYGKEVYKAAYPNNRQGTRNLGHNLTNIGIELQYLLNNSNIASHLDRRYMLNLSSDCTQILNGNVKWNPNKRYDDAYRWDSISLQVFMQEALVCLNKLIQMKIDGVI